MGARFLLALAPGLLADDAKAREKGQPRMIHDYLATVVASFFQPPEPDPDSDSD